MQPLDFVSRRRRCREPLEPLTTVFRVREDEWRACWRGQVAPMTFNSKGAAQAYLDTCEAAGKLRS